MTTATLDAAELLRHWLGFDDVRRNVVCQAWSEAAGAEDTDVEVVPIAAWQTVEAASVGAGASPRVLERWAGWRPSAGMGRCIRVELSNFSSWIFSDDRLGAGCARWYGAGKVATRAAARLSSEGGGLREGGV